jgi:hypothetical protein
MSKSFINTIIQNGGELTDSKKVEALNIISKAINKKMKIIEYKYGIQIKLNKLPESNADCIPKKIGIQSFAQINGPFRGQIPFYTTTEIAMPSISTVTTGVPLTPFGPFIGVQGLAINPFGTTADKLDERLKKADETLTKLLEIRTELEKKKTEGKKCADIDSKEEIKKYFDCVDLEDPASDEEIINKIKEIISK